MSNIASKLILACVVLFGPLPLNAKILNTSGTWKLNLEKSDFGKGPKPQSIMVKVVHKEPAFKYSVTGTNAEGQPMNVEFDGAIDFNVHGLSFRVGSGDGVLEGRLFVHHFDHDALGFGPFAEIGLLQIQFPCPGSVQ